MVYKRLASGSNITVAMLAHDESLGNCVCDHYRKRKKQDRITCRVSIWKTPNVMTFTKQAWSCQGWDHNNIYIYIFVTSSIRQQRCHISAEKVAAYNKTSYCVWGQMTVSTYISHRTKQTSMRRSWADEVCTTSASWWYMPDTHRIQGLRFSFVKLHTLCSHRSKLDSRGKSSACPLRKEHPRLLRHCRNIGRCV